MDLKKLEVPTASITDVKKSPMDVFQEARDEGTGVYIFNREKVVGVMITREQYELLLSGLESSEEEPVPEVLIEADDSKLADRIKRILPSETTLSAKKLDEKMVSLGFITKKTGFGGVTIMMKELSETGKIRYQLRKRSDGKPTYADVVATSNNQSSVSDSIILKKIYLIEQ